MRMAMYMELLIANKPVSVVASAYDGMRNGSIVMMKIPKPKPVVRWMKLAMMQSTKMEANRVIYVGALTMIFDGAKVQRFSVIT